MNVPTIITLPASVFLGAVVGALEADPTSAFFSIATAKPALLSALLAGVIAIVHLYQPSPAAAPKLPAVKP